MNTSNCRWADPKLTEEFLLTQDEVLDASAWYEGGELKACVAITSQGRRTQSDLQLACVEKIGPSLTPQEILVVRSSRNG